MNLRRTCKLRSNVDKNANHRATKRKYFAIARLKIVLIVIGRAER